MCMIFSFVTKRHTCDVIAEIIHITNTTNPESIEKSRWNRVKNEKNKKKAGKTGKRSSNLPSNYSLKTSNRYSALKDQQPQFAKDPSDNNVNGDVQTHAKLPTKNMAITGHSNPLDNDARDNIRSRKDSSILIIGDSMIKGIRSDKIGRSTGTNVVVKSFPGSTVNYMKDYIEPSLRKKPDKIILHVGTNDIGRNDPKSIAGNILQFHKQIKKKNPKTKVLTSSLFARYDKPDIK